MSILSNITAGGETRDPHEAPFVLNRVPMLMILATLGSVSLGGLTLALLRAPEGYETADGFQVIRQSKSAKAKSTPLVLAGAHAGKSF